MFLNWVTGKDLALRMGLAGGPVTRKSVFESEEWVKKDPIHPIYSIKSLILIWKSEFPNNISTRIDFKMSKHSYHTAL